jgi:hypothetical protein
VRGCIPKLFLRKSYYEGVTFTIAAMACSVLVAALRVSPTNKRDRERLRQLQREEKNKIE